MKEMRIILLTSALLLAGAIAAPAQTASRAAGSANTFPGLNPAAKQKLAAAKMALAFALPTWLPEGFKIENVHYRLGSTVPLDQKQFFVVYRRDLPGGKHQSFSLEAGFDGLGDLMYDGARTVKTPIGTVYLIYQPNDEEGKKLTDFSMTEWYTIGKTAFHYDGMFGSYDDPDTHVMIPLADTLKILRSLKRY